MGVLSTFYIDVLLLKNAHPTCIPQQQALHSQRSQVTAGHPEPLPPVRLLQRIIHCQLHHMTPRRWVNQICRNTMLH
jgi:hypothetical protein